MGLVLLVPFFTTLGKSFLQLDPARPQSYGESVGITNYRDLLTREPEFGSSLRATGSFLIAAVLQLGVSFGLGLCCRRLWPRKLPFSLVLLLAMPLLVSPTVVGLMGRVFLHDQVGLVPRLLRELGLPAQYAAPLTTRASAFLWVVLLDAWQWMPFTTLLFWLCLGLVPRRELEAGRVDALGRLAMLRYLVLPRVGASVAAVTVIRLLEILRLHDLPAILTGGGPGTATLTVSMHAERITFVHQRFGAAAAHLVLIYFAASVAVFVLIPLVSRLRAAVRLRDR